jgi:uncharacterized repeat protein (TIGR03803 family)
MIRTTLVAMVGRTMLDNKMGNKASSRTLLLRTPLGRILIALAVMLTIVPSSWAIKSQKVHKFQGVAGGFEPSAGLVSDGAGNLYGTTAGGGLTICGESAPFCGTVFKLALGENGNWKESVIYEFQGGTDGAGPSGTMVFDAAGNLYGTTVTGGSDQCDEGCGTVFKLSPNQDGTWTESILFEFQGGNDAEEPGLGVIFDAAGNLYGAAGGGCEFGCNGTVFELSPGQSGTWTESLLYTFLGGTDGSSPSALILDGAGNILGTTISGGSTESPCGGCGTVFQLSPSKNGSGSWTKKVLYSFNDGLDGGFPGSGVAFDGAGNLFGEAFDGGSFACPESGCGVVYELTPDAGSWKFSVAHSFDGAAGSKGRQPTGGLTFDSQGNMYGTTGGGGDLACNRGFGCGTIFELSPKAKGGFTFTMIDALNGASGAGPSTGVIVDAAGNLYGTTFSGGSHKCGPTGCGVVFRVTP